ncbi:speckle-type POZ protein A [Trichonephila clavata]|uniref:Speckle-type POZ protein A n=1 Tax=Trichonephila clavata TaxID=2740835 RepID=A0A8X6J2R1_TRICU|nr:speckle-type POZ protein A [Trichonephila clavata]
MADYNISGSESDRELKFFSEIITDHRSVLWTIQNFSLCPTDVDEYLQSPEFTTRSSSISAWTVRIYPRGQTECNSVGKVGLFLHKSFSETEVHQVRYKICFKDVYGRDRYVVQSEQLFKGNGTSWGRASAIERDVLFGVKREELLQNDTLRVYCEITVGCIDGNPSNEEEKRSHSLLAPSISCLDALSSNFETLYETQRWSDFTLQTVERKFPVHKTILAARSTVFAAMFEHDMKEQHSDSVLIPDVEASILDDMLRYVYTGTIQVMTLHKAMGLFACADKYNLDELKTMCKKFLLDHLSIGNVCDIAMMADLYSELELKEATKNFFAKNASQILATNNWEELLVDRPHTASQLLEVIASGYTNKG